MIAGSWSLMMVFFLRVQCSRVEELFHVTDSVS